MSIDLPSPIAAYFAADRARRDEVAQCFAEDGIVTDEGRSHVGRDAIHRWKTGASTKYDYVSEPYAIEESDGRTVVTSRVTGNFPGSPVDLRYAFTLDGGKIARLEIAP